MCDYIFTIWYWWYELPVTFPQVCLLNVKLPDSGDERLRWGAAITDSSHNNPGVFASGPLPQIQSCQTPHSIGTKSDRFSSLLPKELGNSFGSCMLDLGPGQEVDLDLDTLMISRLAQSFRGMWTPGNLVKIFTVFSIWNLNLLHCLVLF